MRQLAKLVVGAIVISLGGMAMAQGEAALSAQQRAQAKLLAYRAARVDGMRKLAERIKGLQITSETTVQDFVAQSDTINTQLDAFLMGAREVGEPKYTEDGICKVKMAVTLKEVITNLKQIRNRCYKGDKFKAEDFDEMIQTNKITVIEETGTGAPREDKPAEDMIVIKEGEDAEGTDLSGGAKGYWRAHVTGQGRLMAVRAAHVDALRKLAERIKGVQINSETTVQDFVAESDQINVNLDTFMKGAREVGVRYHPDELIVEVTMQVKLRTVIETIKTWSDRHYKGDRVKIRDFEEAIQRCEDQIIRETGMGVPPAKYLKDVPREEAASLGAMEKAPEWANQWLKAVGRSAIDTEAGNKGQAKLMAYRAAELDARRKLAEELNGLRISSETTVQDFIAQSDEIRTAVMTFQQGARVVPKSEKMMDDGTAEVTVEIDLGPLWDTVMWYHGKMRPHRGPAPGRDRGAAPDGD